MATDAAPAVSITVVAYNSGGCLRDCLSAIRPSLGPSSAEVIVVDNASPDDSAGIVMRESPEALLIRSTSNLGFAGGCNLAWPHVRGRYWLLLNPDVIAPPDGIHGLVRWLDRRPHLGAASPQLVGPSGELQATGRRFPSAWRAMVEMARVGRAVGRAGRGETVLGGYLVWAGRDFEAEWIPGAAMIVRREAVAKAGLMSERFFMYGEDVEWCWRIRRAGWGIGVAGGIRFQHVPGASAIRTWGQRQWYDRMWRGWYSACRTIRGRGHDVVLVVVTTALLALEVLRAPRGSVRRGAARRDLAIHLALLRQLSLDGSRAVASAARRYRLRPGRHRGASTSRRVIRLR